MNGFKRSIMSLTAAGVVAVLGLVCTAGADATSATATITGNSLAFVSPPGAVSFSAALTGTDQTLTTTEPLDVGDATGSGAGRNITATSTTLVNGGNPLPSMGTTVNSAPSDACDTNSTCAKATDSVSYPYSLPSGSTAPTATKLFNAAAGTGMGDQTATPTWSILIPADAYAGVYPSTWTISLVSGP